MSANKEKSLRKKIKQAMADFFTIEDGEAELVVSNTPCMMVGDQPNQYEHFQKLGVELANLIDAHGPERTAPDLLSIAKDLSRVSDEAWNSNKLCWAFKRAVEAAAPLKPAATTKKNPTYRNDSTNPFAKMSLPLK